MRYIDDDDRDPTPDEVNAIWAANEIQRLAKDQSQPFFMAVGFLRPHTPLVAPKKYFDLFPLEKIKLSKIKPKDSEDTYLEVAYDGNDVHALRFGRVMFENISKSFGSTEKGLKKWTQAYLACVAAVDDNIGQVLDALNKSVLAQNTIVILASDHGFHMGEKDYLYKNSLWEESTRIPLMIRVPDESRPGMSTDATVSLVDIYPTLLDLCNISTKTRKNNIGRSLDGISLRPLLVPGHNKLKKRRFAITAVYAGDQFRSLPEQQHYALCTKRHRYIIYNTGHEELYDHQRDPMEWNNLVTQNRRSLRVLKKMRSHLENLLPFKPIALK